MDKPKTTTLVNQPDALAEGHFAKKQIFSKSWLISWSHRRRFETALRLAQQFAGRRILDYGCGDGTFLKMLMDGPSPPAESIGAELLSSTADDCRRRLGKAHLKFV